MNKLSNPDNQKLALRVVLGFIFIISGYKIAFPADVAALATSYADPAKGWIDPFFSGAIIDVLRIDVGTYLYYQGVVEMIFGVMVLLGLFTPVAATIMGLIYYAIVAANPVIGEIRLSRDLTLMAFSFAAAYYGAGKYSLDAKLKTGYLREGKQEWFSFLLRFGLGYTLVISSIFFWGPMANMLNTTLPLILVFILGAMLMLNIQTKWAAAAVAAWLAFAIIGKMGDSSSVFKALDGTKREIAFLVSAVLLYAMKGDRILTHKTCKKK